MRIAVRSMILLALLFAFFFTVSPALAQDENPPVPVSVPLGDPTNLRAVLVWLASGGGGVAVALWIEKQKWFNKVDSSYKPIVVMAFIAGVALVPQLMLNFIPENVWEVIGPYFATVVAALLIGYPLSQYTHVHINGYLKKYPGGVAGSEFDPDAPGDPDTSVKAGVGPF